MSAFYVFVVLCFLAGVSADSRFKEINTDNRCPTVITPSNFDVNQFLGIWYYMYTTIDYEGEKCSVMYHVQKKDETENLYSAEYPKEGISMAKLAEVQQLDPSQPARFRLKTIKNYSRDKLDRFILGTDYKNYAVIYECYTVGDKRIIDASILTRQEISALEYRDTALGIAAQHGFNNTDFHLISLSSCPLEHRKKFV